MPRLNGFDVLRRLRKLSSMPVIFVTSKCDDVDETSGLDLGADDYIRKPFTQGVLIARIRALLRRHSSKKERRPTELSHGQLKMDLEQYRCTWGGVEVPGLTVTEFEILKLLAQRPGVVRSRDQIIDLVYGPNFVMEDRNIDSHKKRIVQKFKVVDPSFSQLEPVYGLGYRWVVSTK